MDATNCNDDDCRVLLTTLRLRMVQDRPTTDRAALRADLGQLIDVVERLAPDDTVSRSRLSVARSLVVLHNLSGALDQLGMLLSSVHRTGLRPH